MENYVFVNKIKNTAALCVVLNEIDATELNLFLSKIEKDVDVYLYEYYGHETLYINVILHNYPNIIYSILPEQISMHIQEAEDRNKAESILANYIYETLDSSYTKVVILEDRKFISIKNSEKDNDIAIIAVLPKYAYEYMLKEFAAKNSIFPIYVCAQNEKSIDVVKTIENIYTVQYDEKYDKSYGEPINVINALYNNIRHSHKWIIVLDYNDIINFVNFDKNKLKDFKDKETISISVENYITYSNEENLSTYEKDSNRPKSYRCIINTAICDKLDHYYGGNSNNGELSDLPYIFNYNTTTLEDIVNNLPKTNKANITEEEFDKINEIFKGFFEKTNTEYNINNVTNALFKIKKLELVGVFLRYQNRMNAEDE